ncbi:MAG TPA: TonB family protein [Candidatus Solibacter sp.]
MRPYYFALLCAAALAGQTATEPKPDHPPKLIHKVEPVYTEAARAARYRGTAMLWVTVDAQGMPVDISVVSPIGMGLEQKAIEALRQWRFKPGEKNGKPVAVRATVEVNFRMGEKFDAAFERSESARSIYNLGVNYLNGTNASKDEKKAAELFGKAAAKSFAPAQTALARLYVKGIGVDPDPVQAAALALKAAKQNDAAGQVLMGELTAAGLGVAQSDGESFKWYRKAADQGFAPAQFQLGVLYRLGKGVEQDLHAAMRWFTAAADQGFAPAVSAKRVLADTMTAIPNAAPKPR